VGAGGRLKSGPTAQPLIMAATDSAIIENERFLAMPASIFLCCLMTTVFLIFPE
jgi:hypothetical protein